MRLSSWNKQRSKILKLKDKFSTNLSKFLKIKKEMFKISGELEKVLDDVAKNVRPIQLARFLKYVDKIKHRKEIDVFHLWGVKSNKFRVRKDKIGTQDLLEPNFEKVTPTFALIKKKEKKLLKAQNQAKTVELESLKKLFESNYGNQQTIKEDIKMEISPEEIANEILVSERNQKPDIDYIDKSNIKNVNLSIYPAMIDDDSEDSGLPDSACESESDSD